MLESGAVLQERYRIVKLLGQGGMGAVYRAWDLRLHVPVALKEMSPQPGLDQASLSALRSQFQQEAAVLARLNHPNLVRVTDYFEENESDYLVMDFVEGESLADMIAREGAQPEARAITWATQLLDALHYCHHKGVVHRDIKPQNVIVRPDGQATLVDFGLVKLWDPTDPRTRTVMRGLGTPEYAPPEQYGDSGDHTGPPSDLYSLAALLYHALTGQAPPTATDRMAMPERFVPLRRLAPHISPRTEAAVMKALALPVSDRWSTAAEMRVALVGTPPASVAPSPTVLTLNPEQPVAAATRPPSRPITGPTATSVQPASGVVAPRPAKRRWLIGAGVALAVICVAGACISALVLRPAFLEGLLPRTATATVTQLDSDLELVATATPQTLEPTDLPSDTTGLTLSVLNRSPYTVCYLFVSPADTGEWGEDQMGTDQVVLPGRDYTLSLPEGTYDALVQDCDFNTLACAAGVSGAAQIVVGGEGLVPYRIVNQLDKGICFVYASLSAADEWGDDRLGAVGTIPAGGAWVLFLEPGEYDFMLQDCDGAMAAEQYQIRVDSEADWIVP